MRYLLTNKSTGVAKTSRTWMKCTLSNSDVSVNAVFWDWEALTPSEQDLIQDGTVVNVTGEFGEYQGQRQFKIKSITKDLDQSKDGLLKVSVYYDELKQRFAMAIRSVKDPFFQEVLVGLVKLLGAKSFLLTPASKVNHHNYIGGLLEHTLGMVSIAEHLANLYPIINRDLLVTGCLIHDIGKIEEYSSAEEGFSITKRGELLGHMGIGVGYLEQVFADMEERDAEKEDILRHIIYSHHDKLEFGSLVRPKFVEAVLVNRCDMLDAEMRVLSDSLKEPAVGDIFKTGNVFFSQHLYKHPMSNLPVEKYYNTEQ